MNDSPPVSVFPNDLAVASAPVNDNPAAVSVLLVRRANAPEKLRAAPSILWTTTPLPGLPSPGPEPTKFSWLANLVWIAFLRFVEPVNDNPAVRRLPMAVCKAAPVQDSPPANVRANCLPAASAPQKRKPPAGRC